MAVIVKKDKKFINDGGHKPFGVDLDPNKELCHITTPDKDATAYYKKSKMQYSDYLGELKGRFERLQKGKATPTTMFFSGFGKGTIKK